MIITVFHNNDAPLTIAALDALGHPWVDYNVGRGVTEVNWTVGVHLREIKAVNAAGGPQTPVTTIYDDSLRVVLYGDDPAHVLSTIRNNFLRETS